MLQDIQVINEKETRAGFGAGILEAGRRNPRVVALTADLAGSLKLNDFIQAFPDRFIQCGIAEANMIGVAAGLTIGGKVPFATTFANFATSRVYDQIRQSVAYSGKNVKICASHAGLTLGEDGATHQVLEDIGMMKMLPDMTVIVPCDYNQTKAATMAIAEHEGPVYLRFGRPKWPNFTPQDEPFQIGKAQVLATGKDVSIFACGHLVWLAIEAARGLAAEGIEAEVINIHTIKPLDEKAVLRSIWKTGCMVTAEEHQINGGLGDSIANAAARHWPVPHEYVAVMDTFGESGKPVDLLAKYGLTKENIMAKAKTALKRKRNKKMPKIVKTQLIAPAAKEYLFSSKETFDKYFYPFAAFLQEHGKTPKRQENPELYGWMFRVLNAYRKNKIDQAYVDRLNAIGFAWPEKFDWQGRAQVVKKMLLEQDHFSYKKNAALFEWLRRNIRFYHKGALPKDKMEVMREISELMTKNLKNTAIPQPFVKITATELNREKHLKNLIQFREKHPQSWPWDNSANEEEKILGRWCNSLRTRYKKGTLEKEWISKLRTIGFNLDGRLDLWKERFYALQSYFQNNEFPPSTHLSYKWAFAQFNTFDKLSEEQQALLNSINFQERCKEKGWGAKQAKLADANAAQSLLPALPQQVQPISLPTPPPQDPTR